VRVLASVTTLRSPHHQAELPAAPPKLPPTRLSHFFGTPVRRCSAGRGGLIAAFSGPDDLRDLGGTALRDRPPAGYALALFEDTGVLRAVDAWADSVLAR